MVIVWWRYYCLCTGVKRYLSDAECLCTGVERYLSDAECLCTGVERYLSDAVVSLYRG